MSLYRAMPWELPGEQRRVFGRRCDPLSPLPGGVVVLRRGEDWLLLYLPGFGRFKVPRAPSDFVVWLRQVLPRLAPARVQHQKGSATASSTVAATWSPATTAGNQLIAVICTLNSSALTVTLPSGWTAQAVTKDNASAAHVQIFILYAENRSSESGSRSFTLSGTAISAACLLVEVSGLSTSSTLDKTASNSASSINPDTGTTAATTVTAEYCMGGYGELLNGSFSGTSTGFVIVDQIMVAGASPLTSANVERITTVTGTQDCTTTATGSGAWAGAIATFKGPSTPFFLLYDAMTGGMSPPIGGMNA